MSLQQISCLLGIIFIGVGSRELSGPGRQEKSLGCPPLYNSAHQRMGLEPLALACHYHFQLGAPQFGNLHAFTTSELVPLVLRFLPPQLVACWTPATASWAMHAHSTMLSSVSIWHSASGIVGRGGSSDAGRPQKKKCSGGMPSSKQHRKADRSSDSSGSYSSSSLDQGSA